MSEWRFEWRRDWPSVWSADFLGRWEALRAASPHANVYHCPAVVRAWAETHGRAIGAEPLFGLATGPDGALVLLPFVVVTQHGRLAKRRALSAVGEGFFGYHDPLVSVPNIASIDWAAFWDLVRRQTAGDCDQALVQTVHEPFAAGPLVDPSRQMSPVLDLSSTGDLDDVLERTSGNHRGDVRRRLRRIRAEGNTTLNVYGPDDSEAAVRDFRERFVPAYSASWRARPEGCMLDRPGVSDFVERVVVEGVSAGWAHYAALELDGKSVAWHLGLAFRDALYWWIPAHDEAWQAFSPGKVLLALLIERAIQSGVKELHLLTGLQRYKLDWKPELIPLSAMRWHAPSAKGTALGWYDAGVGLMTS